MENLYSLSQKASLPLCQGLSLPRVYQQKGQWKEPITSPTESIRIVQITDQANSAAFPWIRSGKVHTLLSTLWTASGGEQLGTAVAPTESENRMSIQSLCFYPNLQPCPAAFPTSRLMQESQRSFKPHTVQWFMDRLPEATSMQVRHMENYFFISPQSDLPGPRF